MNRIIVRGLLSAVCLCACVAGRLESAVVYVDLSATGSNNGTSWQNAFTDLNAAIAASGMDDQIWVAAGTYLPHPTDRTVSFAMKSSVNTYGGFNGSETLVSERNPSANLTILSGDISTTGVSTDNSYHVVTTANFVTLDGFTITGGYADGASPNDGGAGLLAAGLGSFNCVNLSFTNNVASGNGGAIRLSDSDVDLTLTNCRFDNNEASDGGAIYHSAGDMTGLNLSFSGNIALNNGGAIALGGAVAFSVENALFYDNDANASTGRGGAIYNASSGSVAIVNATVSDNGANRGGGVFNAGAALSLINCVFWSNDSTQPTGASIDSASGNPAVRYSVIEFGLSGSDVAGAVAGFKIYDGDPLFVSISGRDFRLTAGSSCIDRADGNAAPVSDIEGALRHDDAGRPNDGSGILKTCDIGAYEFQGESRRAEAVGLFSDDSCALTHRRATPPNASFIAFAFIALIGLKMTFTYRRLFC
ncbi:MAG: choice-of-anchor Q domain-containing protein [Planctomycetota bacterium]